MDILDDMGYDIDLAEDGFKAISIASEKKYNVALIDIKMPGMNGVETFKKLKQMNSSTKVIMMTAYSVENLVKEALDEGALAVLYKPFNIDKLVEIIDSIRARSKTENCS